MPKDEGPGYHTEGCIMAKVFKLLPLLSKCLGRYFPSQALVYLAHGFLPTHLRLLACGIILRMHLSIPKANRLSVFGARRSLGTMKQVSGNHPA